MDAVIELKKGRTYFHVAFFDKELTIPIIDTYVYDGIDDDDCHLFLDARSQVQIVEGETPEDGHYISFPEGKIHDIVDKEQLIEWLHEEHSPRKVGRSYFYKAI